MLRLQRGLALLALLALHLTSGCLSVSWQRTRIDAPLRAEQLSSVEPGQDDLGSCLDKLGAPNVVQRGPGESMDLIWLWSDADGWGFSISYRVAQFVSPSFRWSDTSESSQGLRLRFDADWRLLESRSGQLGVLVNDPDRERAGERHRRPPPRGTFSRPF